MGGSRPQLSPPMGAPGPSPNPSPGPQRRMPRLEPSIRLTEESPLIQPSEVVVSQRAVLTAEPVLTPIGNVGLIACLLGNLFSALASSAIVH